MMRPSPRILERAARPVADPAGRLLGRVEIYRDLTAQRVFHSKLLQTEKLAALGQMVSGVAHELSNPLTTIQGYAHRLLARQDLPGRTEEVRHIYQEAERAGMILRPIADERPGNTAGAAPGVLESNRAASPGSSAVQLCRGKKSAWSSIWTRLCPWSTAIPAICSRC